MSANNIKIREAAISGYTERLGSRNAAAAYYDKEKARIQAKRALETFGDEFSHYKRHLERPGKQLTIENVMKQLSSPGEKPGVINAAKAAVKEAAKAEGKTNDEAAAQAEEKIRAVAQKELDRVGFGGGKRRRTHRKRSMRKRTTRRRKTYNRRR